MQTDKADSRGDSLDKALVAELRQLRNAVAEDCISHYVGLAMLQSITSNGKVFSSLLRAQNMLISESIAHETRLTSALESLEAGRVAEACQLLGPDH